MNTTYDPQALSRQFNEDEAVWRIFENLRRIRRLLGESSPISEESLDQADWIKAEQSRTVCVVCIPID
ncbi:MAG: hypothetical protein WCJ49_07825 [Deltaproteobacteria bacterium]